MGPLHLSVQGSKDHTVKLVNFSVILKIQPKDGEKAWEEMRDKQTLSKLGLTIPNQMNMPCVIMKNNDSTTKQISSVFYCSKH